MARRNSTSTGRAFAAGSSPFFLCGEATTDKAWFASSKSMLVRLGMNLSDGERPGAGEPWLDRRGLRVGVRTRGGAGPSPTPSLL